MLKTGDLVWVTHEPESGSELWHYFGLAEIQHVIKPPRSVAKYKKTKAEVRLIGRRDGSYAIWEFWLFPLESITPVFDKIET